jgi:hypothetical protein
MIYNFDFVKAVPRAVKILQPFLTLCNSKLECLALPFTLTQALYKYLLFNVVSQSTPYPSKPELGTLIEVTGSVHLTLFLR